MTKKLKIGSLLKYLGRRKAVSTVKITPSDEVCLEIKIAHIKPDDICLYLGRKSRYSMNKIYYGDYPILMLPDGNLIAHHDKLLLDFEICDRIE